MSNQVFQLSVLSQNDPGAADGNSLVCTITGFTGGTMNNQSFPVQKEVPLPIPSQNPPPTPSWFLVPNGTIENSSITVQISCPSDKNYPSKTITITAADAIKYGSIPYNDRPNQIYQEGVYGIFGFAQIGPNGPIYSITAGVLNPQV